MRRDVNKRWRLDIRSRIGDPKRSRIRKICTPWHPEDTAGEIIKQKAKGKLKGWRVEIDHFRIKDDPETGLAIPIWDKWTVPYFEELKDTNPADYDTLYRLECSIERKRSVRKVHYYNSMRNNQNITEADTRLLDALQLGEWSLSIDPAATANEQSSDTGVIEGVLAKSKLAGDKEYGIFTNCWFLHSGPVETQNWIVERILEQESDGMRRPYTSIIIEAQGGIKGMVSIWVHYIKQKLEEQGCKAIPNFITPGTRLSSIKQHAGKLKRLVEIAGYLETGRVRFAGRRVWDKSLDKFALESLPGSKLDLLVQHILNFDGTTNADGVDATTQWVLYHSARLANPFTKIAAPEVEKPKGPFAGPMKSFIDKALNAQLQKNPYAEEQEFWTHKN